MMCRGAFGRKGTSGARASFLRLNNIHRGLSFPFLASRNTSSATTASSLGPDASMGVICGQYLQDLSLRYHHLMYCLLCSRISHRTADYPFSQSQPLPLPQVLLYSRRLSTSLLCSRQVPLPKVRHDLTQVCISLLQPPPPSGVPPPTGRNIPRSPGSFHHCH